ncbi:hypothetical protein, partial [Nocardia wallacei]|uniref:hypothetical protein n=1 Tax=Nocardia wallacei TaxID=480035 RepID=UPI0024570529
GDLPVDTYRLAEMSQDGDFPEAAPGRGQMFVGTPENAEFLVLRRGKAFLDRLLAAGAPGEAVAALRERLFSRSREHRPPLDAIKDTLDEAAEHYGLGERFEPLPGGRGAKVHTIDEMDTVVDEYPKSDAGITAERGSRSGSIKATDFPFPGRVQNFAERADVETSKKKAELREFARWQADAANAMVGRLRALDRPPAPKDWETEYWRLMKERATQKALLPNSRYDTPISDEEPNIDWIGPNIRRDGGVWDPDKKRWVGGLPTPLTQTYARIAALAMLRFRQEGVTVNELQNTVRLSDRTEVNGNRITRNEAAAQVILAGEVGTRPKWKLPKSDEVVVVTATEADRQRIFQDALEQLSRPGKFTLETWADVAYKLFQSPQRKNGSDAVIRTFLVGAAEYHMGRVPDFPHDIDLLAMTLPQRGFIDHIMYPKYRDS